MSTKIPHVLVGGDFSPAVIALIERARVSIDIATYDWRWYEGHPTHPMQQVNIALLQAIKRGVRVRAVLNNKEQAVFLSTLGFKAQYLSEARVLHSKMILIDEDFFIVGSHNFTSNATTRNIELSVILPYTVELERARTFFENLYNMRGL